MAGSCVPFGCGLVVCGLVVACGLGVACGGLWAVVPVALPPLSLSLWLAVRRKKFGPGGRPALVLAPLAVCRGPTTSTG